MDILRLLSLIALLGTIAQAIAREAEPNGSFFSAQQNPANQLILENSGQTDSFYFEGQALKKDRLDEFGNPEKTPDGKDTIKEYVAVQDDFDFFYIDISQPGTIPITFSCNHSRLGTWQLNILDSNGTNLSGYPVSDTQCRDTISGGFNFEIQATSPGRYFILIRGPLWIPDANGTKIAKVGGTIDYSDYKLRVGAGPTAIPLLTQVRGQISALLDVDNYAVEAATAKTISLSFSCNASVNSPRPGDWIIQTFDSNNLQISSYTVNNSQCREASVKGSGPFDFDIDAKGPGTYYVRVKGPWHNYSADADAILTGVLDNSDYLLKLKGSAAEPGTNAGTPTCPAPSPAPAPTPSITPTPVAGAIPRASFLDTLAEQKDKATFVLSNCGSLARSKINITATGLELTGLDESVPISLQIGEFSCASTATLFKGSSGKNTTYVYPKPKPAKANSEPKLTSRL